MMMVEVTQADREAAWPLRPECYTQRDYERWMSGLYDNNNVGINRLSAHRIQSTAELQSKLDKAVEANNECLALWESCDWNATKPELHGPMYDAIQKMRKVRDAAIKGASHE